LSLQRALEMGSYQTAWVMLHRLRSVLVRPGRERLTGTVEVDETYIGGEEPGLAGGRAKGKKALVGVAVEVIEPRGYGRCRMRILREGSAASLHPFVTENVEPGATVITDGWQGYAGIDKLSYHREARSQRAARARGEDAGALLPGVHRVASLAQRWLLGTHQGRVEDGQGSSPRAPGAWPVQGRRVASCPGGVGGTQPGDGLLPRARARRRAPARALPRPGPQPQVQAQVTWSSPLRWISLRDVMNGLVAEASQGRLHSGAHTATVAAIARLMQAMIDSGTRPIR